MKINRIIIFTAIVFSTISCKKYPEGPWISLISRPERIDGKWVASSAKYNENDSFSNYRNHIWEFTKRGTVILQIENAKKLGVWTLASSDKDFVIDFDNGTREIWNIRKLKNKEFWLRNKQSELELRLKLK